MTQPATETRIDCKVLGEIIGTATDYDLQDGWACMVYYNFQRNNRGLQTIPNFPDGADLYVDYEEGELSTVDDQETETIFQVDWSVFNL